MAHWGWPQFFYAGLMVFGAGMAAARFGQPKRPDTYDIIDVLIAPAICVWVLWMGGFWS